MRIGVPRTEPHFRARLSRRGKVHARHAYELARFLDSDTTWNLLLTGLFRNASLQLRRRVRQRGYNPETVLTSAPVAVVGLDLAPDATKRAYVHAREKGKPKKGRRVKSLPPESEQP